jgi:16S rRNA (cytidine1402-2'-O)-methyltransferase
MDKFVDKKKGSLYLVATPIGNPQDLSPRAAHILDSVDYIAAEDTRRAARLLSSLGIGKRLVSYFEHNQASRHDRLLEDLESGLSLALISDAGMPAISDPGEALVRLALDRGIPVTIIPGPSALLAALAISGLDTSRFVFEGFLPVKGKARRERLEAIQEEARTLILYEAPHRIQKTLDDFLQAGLGERKIALARELTKPYEECLYFTVEEARSYYQTVSPRGEFSLVLEGLQAFESRTGQSAQAVDQSELEAMVKSFLDQGLGVKEAARRLSEKTGQDRRLLYDLALRIRGEDHGRKDDAGSPGADRRDE